MNNQKVTSKSNLIWGEQIFTCITPFDNWHGGLEDISFSKFLLDITFLFPPMPTPNQYMKGGKE